MFRIALVFPSLERLKTQTLAHSSVRRSALRSLVRTPCSNVVDGASLSLLSILKTMLSTANDDSASSNTTNNRVSGFCDKSVKVTNIISDHYCGGPGTMTKINTAPCDARPPLLKTRIVGDGSSQGQVQLLTTSTVPDLTFDKSDGHIAGLTADMTDEDISDALTKLYYVCHNDEACVTLHVSEPHTPIDCIDHSVHTISTGLNPFEATIAPVPVAGPATSNVDSSIKPSSIDRDVTALRANEITGNGNLPVLTEMHSIRDTNTTEQSFDLKGQVAPTAAPPLRRICSGKPHVFSSRDGRDVNTSWARAGALATGVSASRMLVLDILPVIVSVIKIQAAARRLFCCRRVPALVVRRTSSSRNECAYDVGAAGPGLPTSAATALREPGLRGQPSFRHKSNPEKTSHVEVQAAARLRFVNARPLNAHLCLARNSLHNISNHSAIASGGGTLAASIHCSKLSAEQNIESSESLTDKVSSGPPRSPSSPGPTPRLKQSVLDAYGLLEASGGGNSET